MATVDCLDDDNASVYHIIDPSVRTIHTCGAVLDDGFAQFPYYIGIGQPRVTVDVSPSRGSLRLDFGSLTLDEKANDTNLRLHSDEDTNDELGLSLRASYARDLPLLGPIGISCGAVRVLFVSGGASRHTSLRSPSGAGGRIRQAKSEVDADGDGCEAYAAAKYSLCV